MKNAINDNRFRGKFARWEIKPEVKNDLRVEIMDAMGVTCVRFRPTFWQRLAMLWRGTFYVHACVDGNGWPAVNVTTE